VRKQRETSFRWVGGGPCIVYVGTGTFCQELAFIFLRCNGFLHGWNDGSAMQRVCR
jgi:hypothetical protein